MRKVLLMFLVALTAGWVNQVNAQNPSEADVIRCYTMETDAMLRAQQPELGTLDDFERWLAPLVEEYKAQQASNERVNAVTTIPIVFHVIHDNDAVGSGDNVSTALINAQITQLNNDFRRISGTSGANTSAVGADTEVEFCAATVDPNGGTLTTPGINRINRSTKGWSAPPYGTCQGQNFNDAYIENTIKPQSQWDPTKYLNIWVMDLTCGILGYAQFPSNSGLSGLNTNGGAANTDGVVVIPSSVGSTTNPNGSGSYNKGRTLTHEIGHWVGLRHIWGDGGCSVDDYCNDTPTSDGANYGCPTTHVSCSSTDMVRNYMDYTDDDCMNIYTQDQKARIQAVLANSPRRSSLGSSTACGGGTGGGGCSSTVTSFPYSESFESGLGAWTQASGDDLDWTRNSGGTPSSNTGPSSAADGSFYVHVEASSPNYPSKRTILTGPCFDLPTASATLSFQYHMYGATMGSLNLEVSTDNGTSWSSIWNRSGDQGNAWATASVSLASYAGSTIALRFNGLTGTSYTGDMSVDDLSIAVGGTGGGGCTNGISSFPYSEGFESGLGGWTQGSGDDFDWTRQSGGTPSSNTGPSSAASGSFYVYTESSTPNYSNKVAILNSPCFDLSSLSSATFSFQYHMYGAAAMGGMVLEARTGSGAWSSVWSESGNQGNSWQSASVNLDAYAGGTVELRFVGTTGTTWQGDMAVDDVSLSSGGSSGGCNTVTITLTFDDYPEETSWQILDGSTVVASGGTYASQPDGSTLVLTECLADGCYDFVISDAYGDGICCSYGNGSYLVTNSSNATLASGGSFTSSESTNFCVSGGNRAELSLSKLEGLTIYPNPVVSTLNYAYESKVDAKAVLRIADMTGRIVHTEGLSLNQGVNQGRVDVPNLAAGSYMLSISTEDALLTKRFIIAE